MIHLRCQQGAYGPLVTKVPRVQRYMRGFNFPFLREPYTMCRYVSGTHCPFLMLSLKVQLPLEEGAVVKGYRVHPYRNAVRFENWYISLPKGGEDAHRTDWYELFQYVAKTSDVIDNRYNFNGQLNAGHAVLTYQGALCGDVEVDCCNNEMGLELATVVTGVAYMCNRVRKVRVSRAGWLYHEAYTPTVGCNQVVRLLTRDNVRTYLDCMDALLHKKEGVVTVHDGVMSRVFYCHEHRLNSVDSTNLDDIGFNGGGVTYTITHQDRAKRPLKVYVRWREFSRYIKFDSNLVEGIIEQDLERIARDFVSNIFFCTAVPEEVVHFHKSVVLEHLNDLRSRIKCPRIYEQGKLSSSQRL